MSAPEPTAAKPILSDSDRDLLKRAAFEMDLFVSLSFSDFHELVWKLIETTHGSLEERDLRRYRLFKKCEFLQDLMEECAEGIAEELGVSLGELREEAR